MIDSFPIELQSEDPNLVEKIAFIRVVSQYNEPDLSCPYIDFR